MKNLIPILLLLILLGCDPRSETFVFKSPNDSLELQLSATRKVQFDPWKVYLKAVRGEQKTSALMFEYYTDYPDTSNIKVNWLSNSEAVIRFIERNDEVRQFRLEATKRRLHLVEEF